MQERNEEARLSLQSPKIANIALPPDQDAIRLDEMELRHLRYFVAVAEELHFGRAARRLNVAQPPLSQQVRILEAELGVTLLLRTSRRVELTTEGRMFLEHASLVLLQAERAVKLTRAVKRGEAGRIAIGFVTSAVYALLPKILREYHRKFPDVEMSCHEMTPARQLAALRQREIDVAIVRLPVREENFSVMELSKERLLLALPTEHPRAGKSRVRLRELAGDVFIMVPRPSAPGFYDALLNECRRAGFNPRVGHEANEWQTVLALVAAGLGVALVPESLRHWQRPGVVYLELSPRTGTVALELVWRTEAAQPLVTAFAAVAKEVALQARGAAR